MLVAMFFVALYGRSSHGLAAFLIPESILVAFMMTIGIGGLAAFGRRDTAQPSLLAAKPPRIAGDGTHILFDGLSLVLGIAGFFAVLEWWERWGKAHHMPGYEHGFPLSLVLIALLITTFLHETGHAFAGLALGMKLRAFLVGPFQWKVQDGRWKFRFALSKILAMGGATGLLPTNPQQDRWETMGMIAAGPAASLLTGLIAFNVAIGAKGQFYEPAWGLLAMVASCALIEFAVNLLPLNPDGAYSDGAQIYQLLKGGPWADLHKLLAVVGSTTVTALRPRDFDIEAIRRTERSFTTGRQALVLRLIATSYYLDCERFQEAREALADAEAVYAASGMDVPAEVCMAFVYRIAFLRRDAACAQVWWERMEAKKPAPTGADYWLAKSALLWSEGRLEEAREAWDKGDALAQKLPRVGDGEFDRHRCLLLRQELDAEVMATAG
jgi:hypothetical protein